MQLEIENLTFPVFRHTCPFYLNPLKYHAVKRRYYRYRQIDFENDSEQGGEEELDRIAAGYQAGEKAYCYATCH